MNYNAWITGNYSNIAKKMLNQMRLIIKVKVIQKKVIDKMVDMIKQYKDLKHIIE